MASSWVGAVQNMHHETPPGAGRLAVRSVVSPVDRYGKQRSWETVRSGSEGAYMRMARTPASTVPPCFHHAAVRATQREAAR